MSKFFNCIQKYEKIKNPIQWIIYAIAGGLLLSALLGVIFGKKSCNSNNTIETVEAKYFMNETVTVHNNFDIKVYYAKTVNSISYIKNKKDINKTVLQGNYIEVNLDITQRENSTKDSHKLDPNDFKLRNHSGVYLPLNDIMSLFDIDAMDVHIDTDENGFVMSSADFSNKNAVKDFTWVNTKLQKGETVNITLFFDMQEGYQVEKDLMLLEVDFYIGRSETTKGEDIVLFNCKRN